MDNIDVKRLEHDLEYWNSVAPEGATHYGIEDHRRYACWVKNVTHDGKADVMLGVGHDWFTDARVMGQSLIPRPAPAWDGEGWPPVGVECEVRESGAFREWSKCRVLALNKDARNRSQVCVRDHNGDMAIFYPDESTVSFRPLKTEKERVVEAVMDVACFGDSMRPSLELAYDAGALKMPGGKK